MGVLEVDGLRARAELFSGFSLVVPNLTRVLRGDAHGVRQLGWNLQLHLQSGKPFSNRGAFQVKNFLLKPSSECLVSFDPHFLGNGNAK